jgi:hypothetical protein
LSSTDFNWDNGTDYQFQRERAMPRTIVAVAIGAAYEQIPINDPHNIPAGVRDYINGFVEAFPYLLGNDYTIDYRECPAAQLGTLVFTNQLQADYILCFSTTVVIAAARAYPEATNKPIIGNTSHPEKQPFHNQRNVCGVSAERSDDAQKAYGNFLETVSPALNQATVLHDPNYDPSKDSLRKIRLVYDPPVVNVSTTTDVQNAINNAAAGSGILLLPVDWMFGSADAIIGWAINRRILDFWFVTDWVVQSPNPSAFGGYGVSQKTTGNYMAQQLAVTWNGNWPNPAWVHVKQNDRTWLASQTRAAQNPNYPNVKLNPNNPPTGPGKVP